MTPTTPTARRQDLNQECPSTRNTSLESQHNSARYIRYQKAAQGEVSNNNRLRDFWPICWQLSSSENIVTSTFQAIQNCLHQDTPEKVRNTWQIAILQIYWCVIQNSYHLTVMLQVKIRSFSEKLLLKIVGT